LRPVWCWSVVYQLVTGVKCWENVTSDYQHNEVQVTLQANMDTVQLVTGTPVRASLLSLTFANIFLHQKSGL